MSTPTAAALAIALRQGWLAPHDIATVETPSPAAARAPTLTPGASEAHAAAPSTSTRALVAALTADTVYTDVSNVETNRKLWDAYATDWGPDKVGECRWCWC